MECSCPSAEGMPVSERHSIQKLDVEGLIRVHLSPTTSFSARYTTLAATYSRVTATLGKDDPDTGAVPQNPDQDLPPAYSQVAADTPPPYSPPVYPAPAPGVDSVSRDSTSSRQVVPCIIVIAILTAVMIVMLLWILGVIQFPATPGADSQP